MIVPYQPSRQVVFVHGLNGDKVATWTNPDVHNTFWPDWLTEDTPETAVWSLGYPASPSRWQSDGSAMALPDRAANVLPTLVSEIGPTSGDIVFVGYSLGGLLTQSVLRLAEARGPHDANVAAFLRRVRGIVLLGTPNTGSGHASFANFFSWLFRPRETIKDLRRDNAYIRDLNTWFRGFFQKNNLAAIVIREHKPVRCLGVIVKPSSADPGLPASVSVIPVNENHVSLSHPMTRESEVYRHIMDFLRSPLDGRHADTLIANGLKDVKSHGKSSCRSEQSRTR